MQLNAYLTFGGQCEVALKFYEEHLGAKIVSKMTFEGTPMGDKVPAEWKKKIIHARMMIGNDVLMASDTMPEHYHKPQGISVSLSTADPAEAERVFKGLSQGASVTMPIQETFWALRFGMLVDQFGIPWMINCEKPMPAK